MELVVGGHAAYAYTAGHAVNLRRPTIAFVHGAGNDHGVFLLQSRYFAYHAYNALAVDLPGHGRSGGTPLATIGAMADWLTAFLDAAGIEQAALVGHSMGSLVALESGALHPDRVRALAVVGTSARRPVAGALL